MAEAAAIRPGSRKPRLGLALGGGALKGTAHIGVLRVLEANGLRPDIIVGTSAGSLAGCMYAAGLGLDRLSQLAHSLSKEVLFDFAVSPVSLLFVGSKMVIEALGASPRWLRPTPNGLVAGRKYEEWVRAHAPVQSFEECVIPTAAVATDIHSGEAVVFCAEAHKPATAPNGLVFLSGADLPAAIRASSAIPWFYAPKRLAGRLLVDGAVAQPVPAQVARVMGADVVVAVDLGSNNLEEKNVHGMARILDRSTQIGNRHLAELQLRLFADVVIRPAVSGAGLSEFDKVAEWIEMGRQAAEHAIVEIYDVLDRSARKLAGESGTAAD